jgi:3-phenylpropionate/trans-cinnamate dioxygenase ferredoxin component
VSEFQHACLLGDLVRDRPMRVVLDGLAIAVVRTDEGVFAVSDRCSHADVSLSEGEVEDCTIECWLHGSAFDLRTGVPRSLPAIVPVATYPVRVQGEGESAVVEIDPTPVSGRTEESA